jgi:hypothetical protein
MAFLTLEDPNAKVKGSRDALGILPIWSGFARHVVTNLTTQTSSARGFTILLLGRYFAERLIEEGAVPTEDAMNVFFRMEQIGAHVRHKAHDVQGDIRGIERVRKLQSEHPGRVPIQVDQHGMILADQKVAGLWGLYSVSARRSGLIPDGPIGLTAMARRFVEENYLPRFNGALRRLLKLLAKGGRLSTRSSDAVFQAVADVLPETFSRAEIDFYIHHLCDAVEVEDAAIGRQARFRELLESHTDLLEPFSRQDALSLIRASAREDEGLARRLERIVHLESFAAPASALFDYILTQGGQTPDRVASAVTELWGKSVPNLDRGAFKELVPEIREHSSPEIATILDRCHAALASGDYSDAVHQLLLWNARVMTARKAGPWVVMTDDGRIDIRYRLQEHLVPTKEDLPDLWYNGYFIDSLKNIVYQLKASR